MINVDKETLIDEIKHLISVDGTTTDINPKYLEYFEIEELEEIRDELIHKKDDKDTFTKNYVDELYDKLS
ncbi:hypothetical protein N9W00_00050 [Arcobacteraceae bacterium]|nr:hypothetical protein [Arcobacteraceae bacterium]